ncbi:hypothetical protein Emag_007391 [Eimeria magna]
MAPRAMLVVKFTTRTVAAARAVFTSLPHGQSSVAGLVGRLSQEHLEGPAVTEDQVECLVGFRLSSAERLAALMGPGRTSLREFLNWVYRAGKALLGTTVATAVPSRPVAAPAAPREPSTSAPFAGPDHPSALPGTSEETTPPPPLPDLSAEEFRLPESPVTSHNPPQQLGMDGLVNGSVGRSPADDDGAAPGSQEKGSAAALPGTEQPAPKRARTPGR